MDEDTSYVCAEPTIQEYARYHKLASDYLAKDPLSFVWKKPYSDWQSDEDYDEDEAQRIIEARGMLQQERPHADDATLSMLATCTKRPEIGDRGLEEALSLSSHRYRDMKVELPMLHTDHECDMMHFKKKILPDFAHEKLQLYTLDDEADEGIPWPKLYHERLKALWTQLCTEKPSISNDAFSYLMECTQLPMKDVQPNAFEGPQLELSHTKVDHTWRACSYRA